MKFLNDFMPDNGKNLKSTIVSTVIIPGIKGFISDVVNILLYGDRGSRSTYGGSSKLSMISYSDIYKNKNSSTRQQEIAKRVEDYNDIPIPSMAKAQHILENLEEIVSAYGFVKIADFYELAKVPGEYPTNDFGWDSLVGARAYCGGDGQYYIHFPPAKPRSK